MGAERDALLPGGREDGGHDLRIARVKAAGDAGARHDLQHRGVIAHRVGTEALAAIAVEIDRKTNAFALRSAHRPSSGKAGAVAPASKGGA